MNWKAILLLSNMIMVVASTLTPVAMGQKNQRRFKEGDEIEYLWLSTWYPGTVLAVENNAVAIEYMWGNSPKRERVEAFKLRFAWEARAITPMRFWSDESKQFRVRAAAVAVKDDFVLLHKDDGDEINVPIAKLSDVDQRLLAKFKEQAGPPVAELPELSSFSISSAGGRAAWNSSEDLSRVAPDAPPSFAKVPMKGVAFPQAHFHESLIRVEPIGGSDGWMVAGTVDRSGELPSRILWVGLTAGQIKKTQLLPTGERLAAVNPASRQILTVHESGPRLTLWSADPTMEELEGKKSWISRANESGGSWNNWSAIVAPNRVLHEWGRQQFVVWDTDSNREVYRIDQESFFSAQPSLSPGSRYIALPEDKRVRIIEAATGDILASLPIEGGSAAGVGFSPDGEQLAILTRSQLAVWKLGATGEPKRYRADSVGTPFKASVEWVDDHSLLIDRETLYDTRLELPVWNYHAKTFEVQSDHYGEKTQTVFGGKLCYAVTLRSPQPSYIIGAVELPGPNVREAVEGLDPESLYVVKRGHRVSLDIQCGEFNPRVRNALMSQIENNGWVYDAGASTVIKAEMGRSETQTVTYKSMSGGLSSPSHTVTVTPFFSSLQVLYNGEVAWQAGSGSGAPAVMFMKEGESAQSKADDMQRPYPELFDQQDIPEKIFDPSKKKGLGSSLISAQGLTPQ